MTTPMTVVALPESPTKDRKVRGVQITAGAVQSAKNLGKVVSGCIGKWKKRAVRLKARNAGEARVMKAAQKAYRLAKDELHEGGDPVTSKEAYESVWAAADEVGKAIVESAKGEEAEEDPDLFTDEHGVIWQCHKVTFR